MCLIVFSYKQHANYNLVLVANRDEFFKRPTQSLQIWPDYPGIYAGRDLLQGGTWLGLSLKGRFTAVTNYRSGIKVEDDKESRGKLTLDFLVSEQSAPDYMQSLQSQSTKYGGFNLLAADQSGIHYLSNRGGGGQRLVQGIYGLSNAHLDTDWPKVQDAREALKERLNESNLDPQSLSCILHDKTQARDDSLPDTGVSLDWERLLSSRFIQAQEYGTRCTTVLLQKYSGDTQLYEQSFDSSGKTNEQSFNLQLPVFGGT